MTYRDPPVDSGDQPRSYDIPLHGQTCIMGYPTSLGGLPPPEDCPLIFCEYPTNISVGTRNHDGDKFFVP
jgi:hypothetical protein